MFLLHVNATLNSKIEMHVPLRLTSFFLDVSVNWATGGNWHIKTSQYMEGKSSELTYQTSQYMESKSSELAYQTGQYMEGKSSELAYQTGQYMEGKSSELAYQTSQ